MSFSVVYLCMDESCFTGQFEPEPPPYSNILKKFHFITIFCKQMLYFLSIHLLLLFKGKINWEQLPCIFLYLENFKDFS